MKEVDEQGAQAGGEQPERGEPRSEPAAPADQETGLEAVVLGEQTIEDELGRLQQEVTNLKELYLRKLADFDNYRKRQEREMSEFRRTANADLIRECLPVIDNLERALAAPGGNDAGLRQGVELVLRQYVGVLTRHGLVQIDPLGDAFDPGAHEAIQRLETADAEEATVTQVLQKGYLLGDKLLRPALVVVAVPVQPGSSDAPDDGAGE
jgi:molecular chaperone GrpE